MSIDTTDIATRILRSARGQEIRRAATDRMEIERIVLAELRWLAAGVNGTGATEQERTANASRARVLCGSYTHAAVCAKVRAQLRAEPRGAD
jgi:hypothetical protein